VKPKGNQNPYLGKKMPTCGSNEEVQLNNNALDLKEVLIAIAVIMNSIYTTCP